MPRVTIGGEDIRETAALTKAEMRQGEEFEMEWYIVDKNGNPVDVTSYTLSLTLKPYIVQPTGGPNWSNPKADTAKAPLTLSVAKDTTETNRIYARIPPTIDTSDLMPDQISKLPMWYGYVVVNNNAGSIFLLPASVLIRDGVKP